MHDAPPPQPPGPPPGPADAGRGIAPEISRRVASILDAVEREADRLREEARAEAARYTAEARSYADGLVAERQRRIAEVSAELLSKSEAVVSRLDDAAPVRQGFENLVRALGDAAERLAHEPSAPGREFAPPPFHDASAATWPPAPLQPQYQAPAQQVPPPAQQAPQHPQPVAPQATPPPQQAHPSSPLPPHPQQAPPPSPLSAQPQHAEPPFPQPPPSPPEAPQQPGPYAEPYPQNPAEQHVEQPQPADPPSVFEYPARTAPLGYAPAAQPHPARSPSEPGWGHHASQPPQQPPSAPGWRELDEAKMTAIQMATSGATRSSVRDHLERARGIHDATSILDEVFGSGSRDDARVPWTGGQR